MSNALWIRLGLPPSLLARASPKHRPPHRPRSTPSPRRHRLCRHRLERSTLPHAYTAATATPGHLLLLPAGPAAVRQSARAVATARALPRRVDMMKAVDDRTFSLGRSWNTLGAILWARGSVRARLRPRRRGMAAGLGLGEDGTSSTVTIHPGRLPSVGSHMCSHDRRGWQQRPPRFPRAFASHDDAQYRFSSIRHHHHRGKPNAVRNHFNSSPAHAASPLPAT